MRCDGIGAGVFCTRALRREKAVARTKAANGARALSYELPFLSAHDPHLDIGIALMFLDTKGLPGPGSNSRLSAPLLQHSRLSTHVGERQDSGKQTQGGHH